MKNDIETELFHDAIESDWTFLRPVKNSFWKTAGELVLFVGMLVVLLYAISALQQHIGG
ncbi:MAG TPA: hypothetical protein VGF82_08040 [Terracidiphilus sp.]|jgi:hypothetical protein